MHITGVLEKDTVRDWGNTGIMDTIGQHRKMAGEAVYIEDAELRILGPQYPGIFSGRIGSDGQGYNLRKFVVKLRYSSTKGS